MLVGKNEVNFASRLLPISKTLRKFNCVVRGVVLHPFCPVHVSGGLILFIELA